jgi:hypothetical protein
LSASTLVSWLNSFMACLSYSGTLAEASLVEVQATWTPGAQYCYSATSAAGKTVNAVQVAAARIQLSAK